MNTPVKKQLLPMIGRESKICELAIRQLENKLRVFEEKYRLSSAEFYERFQQGKMGDEQDFFEWKALFEGILDWQETKKGIMKLEYI
ncbi:hypothetical protein [Desulfonema magnum]|uniref:Uncharacterized protein n=1 Tax=Desulfonema magnum TaxID=45655 RepID=A0A975BEF6_9BACT|nr:hypothetical protein [Desulfonema magnum]QTA84199.1 Uncharacterized protein dnm_001930 [Desulfonema magnum]